MNLTDLQGVGERPEVRPLVVAAVNAGDMTKVADLLPELLRRSCAVAWNEDERGDDFDRLEHAAVAVEDFLLEHHLPREKFACRNIAIEAIRVTPAELQWMDPWCPGHGDDTDCEATPSAPCMGCKDAGYAQEAANR